MKRCCCCNQLKPLRWFSKKSGGYYQCYCKKCASALYRARYRRNKKKYVDRTEAWRRQRRAETRNKLLAYFEKHPCVDCGEKDPIVLDFDHVRGTKSCNVSTLVYKAVVWDAVLAEIEKCEVRCANCHRRKTAKELGYWICPVTERVNGAVCKTDEQGATP